MENEFPIDSSPRSSLDDEEKLLAQFSRLSTSSYRNTEWNPNRSIPTTGTTSAVDAKVGTSFSSLSSPPATSIAFDIDTEESWSSSSSSLLSSSMLGSGKEQLSNGPSQYRDDEDIYEDIDDIRSNVAFEKSKAGMGEMVSTLNQRMVQDTSSAAIAELVGVMLDLDAPQELLNSETLPAFLHQDSAWQALIGYLTRVSIENMTDYSLGLNISVGCTNFSLPHKRDFSDNDAVRRAFFAMRLLVDDCEAIVSLLSLKLQELVEVLYFVFDESSNASFHHFRVVIQKWLKVKPNDTLEAILSHRAVYLTAMMRHFHEFAVVASLSAMINSETNATNKKRLCDTLRYIDMHAIIIQLLTVSVDDLSVLSSLSTNFEFFLEECQQDVNIRAVIFDKEKFSGWVQGLVEKITTPRVSNYQESLAASELLLSSFVYAWKNPESNLRKPVLSTQDFDAQKRLVHSLILQHLPALCEKIKVMNERVNELATIVNFEQRSVSSKHKSVAEVPGKNEESALESKKVANDMIQADASPKKVTSELPPQTVPFTMLRYNIVKIIYLLVANADTKAVGLKVLESITSTTWKQLVNMLFYFRHSNSYHALFFKLFVATVRLDHEATLKALLSTPKLISKMVAHYESESKDTSLRGFILLISHVLRLTAESKRSDYVSNILHHSSEWNRFLPTLMMDTKKNMEVTSKAKAALAAPLMPIPYCGPQVIPPSVEEFVRKMKPKDPSNVLHLGSQFAKVLGFTEEAPIASIDLTSSGGSNSAANASVDSTAKTAPKRKKKKKKKKGSNAAAAVLTSSAPSGEVEDEHSGSDEEM